MGVYHPRGEVDLCWAFRLDASISSEQTRPLPQAHEPWAFDGTGAELTDVDMTGYNINGMFCP
jgi:hypothetical protein